MLYFVLHFVLNAAIVLIACTFFGVNVLMFLLLIGNTRNCVVPAQRGFRLNNNCTLWVFHILFPISVSRARLWFWLHQFLAIAFLFPLYSYTATRCSFMR